MSRLLLVSNRLPVRLVSEPSGIRVERSFGGLATGLQGPHRNRGGLWIGWLGAAATPETPMHTELAKQLGDLRVVPVQLSDREVREFYEHFANGVLWPAFHYQLDRLPTAPNGWETYRDVNQKFALAVAEHYLPGDTVWVQDYQLMLVPAMLRELLPHARIGFFLHIPFPSSEVFSTLPWRSDLLEGLLGADLIGFHAPSYLRHFTTSLRRVLGLEADIDRVRWEQRDVRVGVFPMGVDAEALDERSKSAVVDQLSRRIRESSSGERILGGVDRLDYTKGIPRRVLAVDRLLERHPELVGHVRLVQISAPSRESSAAYQRFRQELDELIGRVNGKWGTPSWTPIHHVNRSVDQDQLSALYRSADIMLVTPLRDGMNLVAMEFVATRSDEDGVLVLSEFAGAAGELPPALHVNPYDIDAIAERIYEGLQMPHGERRRRMRAMRLRVATNTGERWATTFIEALERHRPVAVAPKEGPAQVARSAMTRSGGAMRIFLDYDGTLVPFAPLPHLAVPDPDLLELLGDLASRPGIHVEIVSGRDRATLESWLGRLPVGLHAEHGLWSRWLGDDRWVSRSSFQTGWIPRVLNILEQFTSWTPGSLTEVKTSSLAWHYRMATDDFVAGHDFGEHQARELRLLLTELLSNEPVQIVLGSRVVEIRPHGVSKGVVVSDALVAGAALDTMVAIGDDVTDEDLYAVLPPPAITVNVGDRQSAAAYRLPDYLAVRDFLSGLTTAHKMLG